MKNLRWLAVPVTAVTALLAAGCGSGPGTAATSASRTAPAATATSPSPSPTRPSVAALAEATGTAVSHARSVHVSGSLGQGSQGTIGVDLSLTRSGELSGTISRNGAALHILVTGHHYYVKVTRTLLKAAHLQTGRCSLVCGKWLSLPAPQAKSFTAGIGWTSLLGATSPAAAAKTLTSFRYGPVATVGGQQAWTLVNGSGVRLYVAAEGTPYPLRAVAAARHYRVDYIDWNTATIPAPPPASQVLVSSQLGG